jgi:hypothetical protein
MSAKPNLGLTIKGRSANSDPIVCPKEDSPAALAGILEGDILLSLDGLTFAEFGPSEWWPRQPNNVPIRVMLMRDGKRLTRFIVFDEIDDTPSPAPSPMPPETSPVEVAAQKFANEITPLCPAAEQLGFRGTIGDYKIIAHSAAATAGLLPRDRITGIGVVDPVTHEVELISWKAFAASIPAQRVDTQFAIDFERGERCHEVDIVLRCEFLRLAESFLLASGASAFLSSVPEWKRECYVQHVAASRGLSCEEAREWLRDALAVEIKQVGNELFDAELDRVRDRYPDLRMFSSSHDPFRCLDTQPSYGGLASAMTFGAGDEVKYSRPANASDADRRR